VPELASRAGILLLLARFLAALLLLTGLLPRISLTRILGLLARVLFGIAHSGFPLLNAKPSITGCASNGLRTNRVPRRF
jgi:hypothetical protein